MLPRFYHFFLEHRQRRIEWIDHESINLESLTSFLLISPQPKPIIKLYCYPVVNKMQLFFMEEFKIQTSDGYRKQTFRLKAMGNQWYEIFDESGNHAGEIKIDHENHENCETKGCTLDLPILNNIRRNIFLHKVFSKD